MPRESDAPDPIVVAWEQTHPFHLMWVVERGPFGFGPMTGAFIEVRCRACQRIWRYRVRLPGMLRPAWQDRAEKAEKTAYNRIAHAWADCSHLRAGFRANRQALRALIPKPIS